MAPKSKAKKGKIDEVATSMISDSFRPKISMEAPLRDYKKLMYHVKVLANYYPGKKQVVCEKITFVARRILWNLLFGEASNADSELLAGRLLRHYYNDARRYSPEKHSKWIVKVRDELLRCDRLAFWKNVIVKYKLGPCGNNSPELSLFYEYGGCGVAEAPETVWRTFSFEGRSGVLKMLPMNTQQLNYGEVTEPFDPSISLEYAMRDYKKLMMRKVQVGLYINEEIIKHNFHKIALSMQETIWSMLFGDNPSKNEAMDLIQVFRVDAIMYSPMVYNSWVVKLRNELLKRQELEFWKDVIVKLELGPCWAKDCDYFVDLGDPEPAAFYNHAGCVAPFYVPKN